jgi:branched chain amino acid efflux pump
VSSATDVWLTIALLAVTTVFVRGAGPIATGGRELGHRTAAVIELLAPALLAALIVVETVGGSDGGLDPDARIAGVAAAGGVLAWNRSRMLTAVFVAAAVTAGVRALF